MREVHIFEHKMPYKFIGRQDKRKDGKIPLYARITVNGEIVHFALKKWIDIKNWDKRKGAGNGNKGEAGKHLIRYPVVNPPDAC